MEQAQPLSKGQSPVTLLSGEAGGKALQLSDLSVLEAKLSNGDRHGSAPPINPLNSLKKTHQEKPPKRNFESNLATRDYGCKYCKAKYGSLQSLGGHQNAHKRERAARKWARVTTRIANAFSRVNLKPNPNCSGTQADPVPGYSIAYGPHTRPSPSDVVGPAHKGTPKPVTRTNPTSMVNQLNGIVYQPMDLELGFLLRPQDRDHHLPMFLPMEAPSPLGRLNMKGWT